MWQRTHFYLRQPKYVIRFIVFCLLVIIAAFEIKRETRNVPLSKTEEKSIETTTEAPEAFEVFLRSAYYYPTSKSLGDNALAFVFIADFHWPSNVKNVTVRAWNNADNKISHCKLEIMNPWHDKKCKLVGIYSSCEGIEGMERLEINLGGDVYQEVNFETVSYQKKDVVHCIAPLFAAERWQLLAFAAHTYRRFGSFMHLYVRSMTRPVYDLAMIYEKEGYLKMQPWSRIKFMSIPDYMFNPNQQMAFRSQEAAQTDCLLQYKESTEFITFMDLDDVLIPRLAPTYLEEFTKLIPGFDYVHYHKENVDFEASMHTNTFSMDQIFKTVRFQNIAETGKYATRPTLLNYTAIHFPTLLSNPQANGNGLPHFVDKEKNVIVHLKNFLDLGSSKEERRIRPFPFNNNSMTFNETDVVAIEEDFRRIYSKHPTVWRAQPSTTIYIQHIAKCFHKKYYQHWNYNHPERITYCPNPDMCRIPQTIKVPCANADGVFFSTEHGSVINLHYARNDGFTIEDRCLP